MNAGGVWLRHFAAIIVLSGLTALFTIGRDELAPVHYWNRSLADAAVVMLCLTLAIGPAARYGRWMSPLLPFRRELGIWLTAAALAHVGIYLDGVYQWDITGFFVEAGEHSNTLLRRDAFAAANWVGALALIITSLLALTSNDLSQRLLGKGWKFLQQQTYTLFVLACVHTAIYLYFVIHEGHGIFIPAFWIGALLAAGLQAAGYIRTVILQRRRRAPTDLP